MVFGDEDRNHMIGSVKSYLTDVHGEFLVYIPHYLAGVKFAIGDGHAML